VVLINPVVIKLPPEMLPVMLNKVLTTAIEAFKLGVLILPKALTVPEAITLTPVMLPDVLMPLLITVVAVTKLPPVMLPAALI
jgi:hypothetical protein